MTSTGAVLPLLITTALDYPSFYMIKLEIFSAFAKQMFLTNVFLLSRR
jgi:hypothetical protein